jgi:hypothetical protein
MPMTIRSSHSRHARSVAYRLARWASTKPAVQPTPHFPAEVPLVPEVPPETPQQPEVPPEAPPVPELPPDVLPEPEIPPQVPPVPEVPPEEAPIPDGDADRLTGSGRGHAI